MWSTVWRNWQVVSCYQFSQRCSYTLFRVDRLRELRARYSKEQYRVLGDFGWWCSVQGAGLYRTAVEVLKPWDFSSFGWLCLSEQRPYCRIRLCGTVWPYEHQIVKAIPSRGGGGQLSPHPTPKLLPHPPIHRYCLNNVVIVGSNGIRSPS